MNTEEKSQTEITGETLAEERAALVGKIAAGLAHDLNGPIGIVLGFNDLSREIIASGDSQDGLAADKVEKISEYLDLVDGAAKRARMLTQEIWEFAKSEPGATQEFSVDDQLFLAARLAAPALRSFGIETPVQPSDQPDASEASHTQAASGISGLLITADPSLCAQAFVALLLEAPLALPAGGQLSWQIIEGQEPKIEFRARTWEDKAGGLWPVPSQAETAMKMQGGSMEGQGQDGRITVELPSQSAST